MDTNKSLDYPLQIITALLTDVQTLHSELFTQRALKLTINKVSSRCQQEGVSFLTKALPRLGKALDKALANVEPLNSTALGFEAQSDSQLPKLFGELFSVVLDHSGVVLPDADVKSVISLRQLLYCFYKYELPYDTQTEQGVIQKFERTEEDVETVSKYFADLAELLDDDNDFRDYLAIMPEWLSTVICGARRLLFQVFARFDHRDIFPKHGPGTVAGRQQSWDKYLWKNIPARLADVYPLDAYFFASLGHVVDCYRELSTITEEESSARVCLVPKDSRGPRLISCEPAEFQWIQQGLRAAIYRLVESHPLTCEEVRFTDQQPNQFGALMGSKHGGYATLDLNEASDRVSLGLVRLLFPGQVLPALLASRSLSTQLPSGKRVCLHKFAPMGSALCFPVLALTVWALLRAGLQTRDANSQPTVYVYGDDVIVDTAQAEHAMNILETFGLRINRDKSCTSGFFRESCGMDAYRGVCVTPVRIKTVWSNHLCPSAFPAYVEYANEMWKRGYKRCYQFMVDRLIETYGPIPEKACGLSAPSLAYIADTRRKVPTRVNSKFQRLEYLVWDVFPVSTSREIPGWNKLLRWFAEVCSSGESARQQQRDHQVPSPLSLSATKWSASEYTLRQRNKLRRCWR